MVPTRRFLVPPRRAQRLRRTVTAGGPFKDASRPARSRHINGNGGDQQ